MKKQFKYILVGSLFLFFPFSNLYAADNESDISFFSENNNTNPGGHDPGDDPVDGAPIDSNIIVLIAIAVIVGYYGRNKLIKNN